MLKDNDIELYNLINKEKTRQNETLELIASENFTSQDVLECLGSILTNKYSEGLPGRRYYGGNEFIDEIETLCINRALALYKLEAEEWGVNVQPYSGSVANMGAYLGLIKPGETIMGLDLPSGGHLTHGFETAKKKISHTALIFKSKPYHIKEDGLIDYDELENLADEHKPKLIICGGSAYPRDFDYKKFREVADKCGAYLMCDMAHISGFIATGEMESPFEYCDVVTTTTHKTLRGPRSAMVFFKNEYKAQVNESIFPGLQGGPHNHQIAAVATQLYEASKPEFKEYIKQVKKNSEVLSDELINLGYKISSNGTDCHIVLIDLKNKEIGGSYVEYVCEMVNVAVNKNTVYGDKSALSPNGIRLGTSAMTTRNLNDFKWVAGIFDKCVILAKKAKDACDKKGLLAFKSNISSDEYRSEVLKLKKEVIKRMSNLS
jgi:glycine hydroxymethyltransferase